MLPGHGPAIPSADGRGHAVRQANGCGVPHPRISALRFPSFRDCEGFELTIWHDSPPGCAARQRSRTTQQMHGENDDAKIEETTRAPRCRANTAGRAGPDGLRDGPRGAPYATPRFGETNPRSPEVGFGETNPSPSAVERATEPPGAMSKSVTPLQTRRRRCSALKLCRKLVGAERFELSTPSPPDWCANRAALRSDATRAGYSYGFSAPCARRSSRRQLGKKHWGQATTQPERCRTARFQPRS